MKSLIPCLLSILLCGSCTDQSTLDRMFNLDIYNNMTSLELYNSDEIDQQEWFLLNYTIKRQRDYFGYDIKGKTYREILTMGKEFQANGLPVKTTFDYNGQQDDLAQSIKDIDLGMIKKKKNPKSMKRVLNFSCRYTNTSDKAIALQTSTFQVYGPFKDHLTSVGYESNCLIRPDETITIHYLIDAKDILHNLRFEENYYLKSLGLEEFLYALDIRPAGNTLAAQPNTYSKCKFGDKRLQPFHVLDYFRDVKWDKCLRKNTEGQVTEICLGDAHFVINDAQEIINQKRIGQGTTKNQ